MRFYILLYAAADLAGELLKLFVWYGGEGFFYVGGGGTVLAEVVQRVVVWQGLAGGGCIDEDVVGLADEDTANELDMV